MWAAMTSTKKSALLDGTKRPDPNAAGTTVDRLHLAADARARPTRARELDRALPVVLCASSDEVRGVERSSAFGERDDVIDDLRRLVASGGPAS